MLAVEAPQLASTFDSVQGQTVEVKSLYTRVFAGLGCLQGTYKIKLTEDAKPYVLSLPCRVPIPLIDKVKKEFQRMEALGVIAPIDEPKEWCAGIVVPLKPNGEVRICIDLTHLNQYVCRERLILPAVDETLAKLSGAKVALHWQVPLHPESVLLTTFTRALSEEAHTNADRTGRNRVSCR